LLPRYPNFVEASHCIVHGLPHATAGEPWWRGGRNRDKNGVYLGFDVIRTIV
jgi:hypothetical protein